ncbi:MAG: GHKL domain-containing protein [Oscillospiraceae bacterium]|nr:GHKL domain-containing protein [Oscillospiraceae bacterium]
MGYDILSWVAYIVASAIFLVVVFSYYSAIFSRKHSRAVTYGIGIALVFINFFLMFANSAMLNITVSIFTFTVIALLFSGSLTNRLIFTVFLLIAAIVSEFIVSYAIAIFGNISPYDMQFGTPAFIIGLMLSRTQFAIIARTISRIAENRKLPPISIKRWIVLIALPIGNLLVLYNFLFQRNHTALDIFSSLVVMTTAIAVLTVYGKILSDYEVEVKNRYLEELLSHLRYQYVMAERSIKLVSKTKHDIKNLLIGFKTGIQNQNIESVQNHITKILDEIDAYDGPAKSGNLVIDSIINYKFGIANENQIHFSTDLNISNNLNLDSVVVCQIIGTALDNAIEATEKIEDAEKKVVEITVKSEQGTLSIQITNPYVGDIVTNTKGGIMSSKKNHRSEGIGLQSIMGVVSENDGIYNVDYSDDRFNLRVLLFDTEQAENKK